MDLGANIVNAGNYSMRPHAFSTEHFERDILDYFGSLIFQRVSTLT